ncbi:Lsr2 family DNA-binding protein [Thermomonospora amylolytica]|uniref:Lsr2 family DNA-binding protein n=1 Tax=Thermomonospora amylolytica TaxID=1411117 RepID=UPI000E6B91FE|nr:Lsr2 family protein [Thermomonospora amylolytica]
MTRIDLTTRELHMLIAPVLPHASTDGELPQLNTVHIQARGNVLYAVATDNYTMAATRHVLDGFTEDLDITLDRADVAAMLKLFTYSKDEDPELTLVVDKFPVPVHGGRTIDGRGLRIDAEDGTRLVLYDRTDPDVRPFAKWRTTIGRVIHRATTPATPALILTPSTLPRWAKAATKGERLMMYVGPEQGDPVLFTVEKRFVGIWAPASRLDDDLAVALDGNPWRDELPSGDSPAPAAEPTNDQLRAWAAEQGIPCPASGRIPKQVIEAYRSVHA